MIVWIAVNENAGETDWYDIQFDMPDMNDDYYNLDKGWEWKEFEIVKVEEDKMTSDALKCNVCGRDWDSSSICDECNDKDDKVIMDDKQMAKKLRHYYDKCDEYEKKFQDLKNKMENEGFYVDITVNGLKIWKEM